MTESLKLILNIETLQTLSFEDRLNIIINLSAEEEQKYLNQIDLLDNNNEETIKIQQKALFYYLLKNTNKIEPISIISTIPFYSGVIGSLFYQVAKKNFKKIDFLLNICKKNYNLFKYVKKTNLIISKKDNNDKIFKKIINSSLILPYQAIEIQNIKTINEQLQTMNLIPFSKKTKNNRI